MGLEVSNPANPDAVMMIGLDFGSTTSSAMVATATVGMSSTSGRMELGVPRVVYRSEPVFTPFRGQGIDPEKLDGHIDRWIDESGIEVEALFAGGVIVTGLAAKRINAEPLARIVGRRIGETVIATADDPNLESWLAFMGSCSVLSRFYADTPFINIDIGGGTTNPAYGLNGGVRHTGCHFIGARHFQFEPGTYRLSGISSFGKGLLKDLGIHRREGELLAPAERDAVLDFYIEALEAIARGETRFFASPPARRHQQVAFAFPPGGGDPVIVFSGGVGELIYRRAAGGVWPGTTHYGDLGIDLAGRVLESRLLSAHVSSRVPENMGRATVYGLTLHSTEISGSTIFLSSEEMLPRRDLPIVARLSIDAPADEILRAVSLVKAAANGGCIQVVGAAETAAPAAEDVKIPVGETLPRVKTFGRRLNDACRRARPATPVVVLVPQNYGQALGNYATDWRRSDFPFAVIDEIPDRQAHFVNIGRRRSNIVPVSFYGVC